MFIYVGIPTGNSLDSEVESHFTEGDRYKLPSGVWFVRSNRLTSSEIVGDIGIKVGGKGGLVVAASRYNGVADRALVEKLQVWEAM